MKNYLIFSVSFILLFGLFQVLWGLALTFLYTPDVTTAWNMSDGLSKDTVIYGSGNSLSATFLTAFIAASTAYFIPKVMNKGQ